MVNELFTILIKILLNWLPFERALVCPEYTILSHHFISNKLIVPPMRLICFARDWLINLFFFPALCFACVCPILFSSNGAIKSNWFRSFPFLLSLLMWHVYTNQSAYRMWNKSERMMWMALCTSYTPLVRPKSIRWQNSFNKIWCKKSICSSQKSKTHF